ncbi:MAG: ZIP family metal transporter [Nitrososphaeraceae archaeon]
MNSEILEILNTLLLSTVVSSAFLFGALLSIFIHFPERIRADLAALSAGIFFSTISFSLIDDALREGSFITMAVGFMIGAVVFSVINRILQRSNLRKIKNIHSSKIVIIGTFLDSFPESIFIGVIIALNLQGLMAAVLALFIGNITATMEGAKRMVVDASERKINIIKQWSIVFIIVTIGGPLGWYLEKPLNPEQLSMIISFAAGALMAFITEELIPQAYKRVELHIGLSASFGFIIALALFHYL